MLRTASRLLAVAGVIAVVAGFPLTAARAQTSGDWSSYLYNAARAGYNDGEKIITPSTARKLTLQWAENQVSSISTEPIKAGGVVYYGSWDGYEHAVDATTGARLWDAFLGFTTDLNCEPPTTVGVASTATVAAVKVHGTATQAVFVGGGNGNFYALNASNGRVIWRTRLGTPPGTFLWSSPLLYRGSIYEGVASFGDCPLIRGGVVRMNATTGALENRFYTVPPGCIGADVWGSPTIDTATGDVYFATGNGGPCKKRETLGTAVIKTNASLKLLGSWQVPAKLLPNKDSDFGSTPTLFSTSIRGVVHQMVGIQNKDGIYFAFDRSAISRGPLWQSRVAPAAGNCPQCGGSDGADISPSAYDGHHLFIGGEQTQISGVTCAGSIREVQPSTGQVVWADCLQTGPVIGAVIAVPGVAFVGAGTTVYAIGTSTGTILWQYQDRNPGSNFWGALTVSDGWVYAGNQDGYLYAFRA
jgi:polyvinyl alcohol dehydrogenase (cytochrome)